MPPRRRRTTIATAGALADGQTWRQRYAHLDDLDLDRLAQRLARAARWASIGTEAVPVIHGTPAERLDALDDWLATLHPGRRRFAWHLLAAGQ